MGSRIGAVVLALTAAAAFSVGATGAANVKATVVVANNSTLGAILVGASGRTLYHFTGDHGKTVACTAACAAQWPPVTIAKGAKPTAGAGLKAAKLGTLARPDGTIQVTYNGYTLYRYKGDTGGGQVHGQALESKWFTLGSNGSLVKIDPSSSATGNSSTSGSSTSGSSTSGSSGSGSSTTGSSGSTSGGYGGY